MAYCTIPSGTDILIFRRGDGGHLSSTPLLRSHRPASEPSTHYSDSLSTVPWLVQSSDNDNDSNCGGKRKIAEHKYISAFRDFSSANLPPQNCQYHHHLLLLFPLFLLLLPLLLPLPLFFNLSSFTPKHPNFHNHILLLEQAMIVISTIPQLPLLSYYLRNKTIHLGKALSTQPLP